MALQTTFPSTKVIYEPGQSPLVDGKFPDELIIRLKLVQHNRYGENEHQVSAVYMPADPDDALPWPIEHLMVGEGEQRRITGKEMGHNNWRDASAAWGCVGPFNSSTPIVAIIKHQNPCGMAMGATPVEAYERAFACDPVSAFGGILAVNQVVNVALVEAIGKLFLEVIIAPGYSDRAIEMLVKRKPNLRLLIERTPPIPGVDISSLFNGAGVQIQTLDRNTPDLDPRTWTCVTKRQPTGQEMSDMLFAINPVHYVKSNAIVFVRNGTTIGIGAGQPNRLNSIDLAGGMAMKNFGSAKGAIMASDAFLPFADNVECALKYGITAILQPGGDKKNVKEVIAAADEAGIAMMFTDVRHFLH